jgi:sugar (pentulose or hexulose) kinase
VSPVVIGIDVATASVRTLAVATSGDVIASVSVALPSPMRGNDGSSEQDATRWWPAVEQALARTTSALPRGGGEVVAVAITATSGTIVAVDRHGDPVGPALMYDDRRAAVHNEKAAEIGHQRWRALGMSVSPTASLGRVAWLHEHVPEAAGFRHTPDLIGAKLTGAPVAIDSSHALKSGYDAKCGQWAHEVFEGLGVSSGWLPEVVSPTSVLGETREVAGLPPGCLLIAGMTDGCAAQLATGAVSPGQFVGILGTTYVLKGVTEDLVVDPSGALYSHRHPDGWWLPGGASNTGGEAVAGTGDLTALDEAAWRRGPSGIVAYPLARDGERFPFVAKDARGFVTAHAADAVEAHRARLEGVAFLERLALDHLRRLGAQIAGPLFAAGGGSRSPLWNQIRATTSGLGLQVCTHAESAYGAAMLALAQVLPGGLIEAREPVGRTATLVEPNLAEQAALTESYHRFCAELCTRGWIDSDLLAAATA